MQISYRLADTGRTFSTRPRGAQLREDLLETASGADSVRLDLEGVLSLSYSFADEFLGTMRDQEAHGTLPFQLLVSGASDEVARVIARAEARRAAVLETTESGPCFA